MKTNFLPKFFLLFVMSILIYSCTTDDSVIAPNKKTTVFKTKDTIGGPTVPNPRG